MTGMTNRVPVTNGEFARDIGVHFTMASRYRNGRRIPSTQVLSRIARTYDLPIDELVGAATAGHDKFGQYMREHLFFEDEVDPESVLPDPYVSSLPQEVVSP